VADVDVRIHEAALHEFLHGAAGPVMRDLSAKARKGERIAKALAPWYVRAGVKAVGPTDAPAGPYVDIVSEAKTADGAPLGLFAEVGTKPHVIESHGDYPLRNRETGQVFGRRVNHPGTKAQPHIRPALYAVFSDAL
jgi:hypothetical protein